MALLSGLVTVLPAVTVCAASPKPEPPLLVWSGGLRQTVYAPLRPGFSGGYELSAVLVRWLGPVRLVGSVGMGGLGCGSDHPFGECYARDTIVPLRLGVGAVPVRAGSFAIATELGFDLWHARVPAPGLTSEHLWERTGGPRLSAALTWTPDEVRGVPRHSNLFTFGIEASVTRLRWPEHLCDDPVWVLGAGLVVF